MILADTSVWIDFLRGGARQMAGEMSSYQLLMHPVVLGEIALGNHPNRALLFRQLQKLEKVKVARDDEVLELIESQVLYGSGIGYSDAHLLASVLIHTGCVLWTKDKRLRVQAERLGVLFQGH